MPSTIPVGIAEIDITPDYPVRLSGYGARRDETTRVETPLRAKALAIGNGKPALLITLENCGVTKTFTTEIAKRLRGGAGLPEDRLTICYSHTHTGPCLTGAAPMLFSTDIPPGHQKNIDRYTGELLDKLVGIGLTALTEQKPAYLSWTQGHAGFAANRRNQIGPVDHVMPMMRITDAEGNYKVFGLPPGESLPWAEAEGLATTYYPDADRPIERLPAGEEGDSIETGTAVQITIRNRSKSSIARFIKVNYTKASTSANSINISIRIRR